MIRECNHRQAESESAVYKQCIHQTRLWHNRGRGICVLSASTLSRDQRSMNRDHDVAVFAIALCHPRYQRNLNCNDRLRMARPGQPSKLCINSAPLERTNCVEGCVQHHKYPHEHFHGLQTACKKHDVARQLQISAKRTNMGPYGSTALGMIHDAPKRFLVPIVFGLSRWVCCCCGIKWFLWHCMV